MNLCAYKCNRIVTLTGIQTGYILIQDDKIVDLVNKVDPKIDVVDYSDLIMLPGIIDVHNHGFAGWSMTDYATIEEVQGYLKSLCSVGVTTVLPTAKPEAFESIANVCTIGNSLGASVYGIHSEGPFWARGGENTVGESWPKPSVELTREYIDKANGCLKMMAIAPELEGANDVIHYLHQHNIKVAACHTKAKSQEIKDALKDGGFDIVTHLCNGMQGIHHRDVGALGQFLLTDNIYYELIADLNHVCADMIGLILKLVGTDRICLISDSNYMANMPVGRYERYGKEMIVDENGLIKDVHGRICGSGKYVLFNMKQLMKYCGVSLVDVSKMASYNPAKFLGIDHLTGSLGYGKYADFTVIDDDFNCQATYVHGSLRYDVSLSNDLINPKAYERKLG